MVDHISSGWIINSYPVMPAAEVVFIPVLQLSVTLFEEPKLP